MGAKAATVSMLISATGISTSPSLAPSAAKAALGSSARHGEGRPGSRGARARFDKARGFSLLELMVVVTIIGIFAGVAVLSLGVLGNDREIKHEALRLKSLMDFVREEAVMQSRDYGVLFSPEGYRFYVYDYQQMKWIDPSDDRLLAKHELEHPLNLTLRMEDRKLVLDPERGKSAKPKANEPKPQVVILSSGEITPFQAAIYRDVAGGRYLLSGGLDGKIEIAEDGFGKGR
jgi:general secretion pathway protein H